MKIGTKVNDLTVKHMLSDTVAQCECTCGNIFVIEVRSLENGVVENCGCKSRKLNNPESKSPKGRKLKVNAGDRFGKLTVMEYLGNREVLTLCDCGEWYVVRTWQLTSKNEASRVTECTECRNNNK